MQYELLIDIVSSYLNEKKITLDKSTNFKELYILANRQGISGLIYDQIGEQISDYDLKKIWQKNYLATIQKGLGQEQEFNKILDFAEKEQVFLVCYKGSILKYLYPNPYLRLMGDLDFGFNLYDDKKIAAYMKQNGYRREESYGFHRAYFKDPYFEIEFHGSLHEDCQISLACYKQFIKESVPYRGVYGLVLNPTMHYLFLITHLYQHMAKGGIGIRHFIDIYLFKSHYEIAEDVVLKELSKVKLTKFYQTLELVINRMFAEKNLLDDDLYYRYLDYIFKGGIYGATDQTLREERGLAATENSKLKYILKRLFPSFHDLCEKYKVLKKPFMWLFTPFFYVYRIISYFFKKKNFKEKIRFATNKINPDEEKFAIDIGLKIRKDDKNDN